MAVSIGRVRLKIHPLALMFPVVAAMLGAGVDVVALLLALLIHESAHLLAARATGVHVRQLRLMPFGGAICLENPYALPPCRLLAVAVAGPVGSGLGLLAAAALAQWRVLSPGLALALMRVNLTLMAFNLLPALPLDGGRALYAVLSPRLGPERAAEWGIRSGRVVAVGLLLLATAFALRWRRVNLSLLFAAIFILASAADERHSLSDARARTLLSSLRPIDRPVPMRLWAVGSDCNARTALRVARPDVLNLYAIYKDSRLSSITDDRRLVEAALKCGMGVRVGQIPRTESTARPPHPGSGS